MEAREYEQLREKESGYWWHVGRREIIRAMLEQHVPRDPDRPALDVGCGTGSNFPLLAPWGRFVGTEVSRELYSAGRRPDRPVALARGEALPFADGSLGLCTLFDVLEHVEAEDVFLRELMRVLQPGGLVLLSVPAYMFLWSDHDVSLHHFRRYARRELADSLTRNGLEIVRITYAMASILPPVAAVRWMSRLTPRRSGPTASYVPTPAPIGSLLTRVLGLEAAWIRKSNLPFGTSLLALARKGVA